MGCREAEAPAKVNASGNSTEKKLFIVPAKINKPS